MPQPQFLGSLQVVASNSAIDHRDDPGVLNNRSIDTESVQLFRAEKTGFGACAEIELQNSSIEQVYVAVGIQRYWYLSFQCH